MPFPHLDEEKLDELLLIIERNRWERLRRRQLETECIESRVESDESGITADSVRIVLFGAECPFSKSLIEMFRVLTVITFYDDPERMITFCLDHSASVILLDIDPPTDCHLVTDVFAAIRMLLPKDKLFVCTNRKSSLEVVYFKMHGASVLEKPVLRKQVKWFCDSYL